MNKEIYMMELEEEMANEKEMDDEAYNMENIPDDDVVNSDYEYEAKTQNCSTSLIATKNVVGSNLTEYQFVIPNSVEDLKESVLKTPVAIAVDANNVYFRFYKEGVIEAPSNFSRSINHAVVLVGFDYDEDGMYWIIQNSWGKDWGDNGFCKIRVQEGSGNLLCQKYGVYPIK